TNLGLDLMLVGGRPGWTGEAVRMAPSTATSLVFLGVALLLLDTETRSGRWPAGLLIAGVLLPALPRLVGYSYGLVPATRTPYNVMAPYSAVELLLLATGLLAARPERGFVSILGSPTEGGHAGRWLVPAALLVPLVLGGLAVAAAEMGLIVTSYVAPVAI